MAVTGLSSAYGNVYESRYTSSKKEVTEKQEAEQAAGKKYTNASEYYAYLKDKYPCLTASNYKVTISPVYLEKCIKDPKEAEELEKNLAHVPVSKQMETVFWSAQGARVVNDELIFDENGNCCGSPKTYVTNSHSSSGSRNQDEKIEKRAKKKSAMQNHYEKRKYLREQFEERQARKALIRGQLQERQEENETHESLQGKSVFSRKRNVIRAMERYEASILKS
ncbi:MAG: hypothetical protein HDR16_00270 [Lachnospiraceae bacterium]|nr:hypothetical protein [Lachnospiraceae bacterium]